MKIFMIIVKKTILFLASIVLLCCTEKNVDSDKFPFDIHKRLVISEKCDLIVYASNVDNYFYPQLIRGTFKGIYRLSTLGFKDKSNFFPQSVSCDCGTLSIIKKKDNNDGFDLLTYNLSDGKRALVAQNIDGDGGSSMFSSKENILAYLDDHKLYLYDIMTHQKRLVNSPLNVDFKNLNWSVKGKYLFLEDYAGDIWRYEKDKEIIKLIWESTKQTFTTDRLITPSADDEEVIYFISDHDSQFNQIYKLGSHKEISSFVVSEVDKFLTKRPISEQNFYYRINKDGVFMVQQRKKGLRENLKPKDVVIYDYYQGDESTELFLLSSIAEPVSVYIRKDGSIFKIVNNKTTVSSTQPIVIYNSNGMYNLVYKPTGTINGWQVWLHGGPHEQVSLRYNPYIAGLNSFGWGVIVLNYPGSTGIGNDYELRFSNNSIEDQISRIREDINQIKTKFKMDKYGVVGISYGSIIANKYVKEFRKEVSSIIEISGINTSLYPSKLKRLYIFGTDDYILKTEGRSKLITQELKSPNVQFFEIKNEGHIINQRESQWRILKEIEVFLSDGK